MFELNKNFNLLDEQLAESGLEMQWVGAVLGGVSALASIAGGISGAKEADKANKAQKVAYEKQKNAAAEQARNTNIYNRRKFETDRDNYRKQAQYNFDTAVKSWQYQTAIRALQEKTDAEKYLLNTKNSNQQLTFNEIAASQGLTREQLAIQDSRTEYALNRQDVLVSQLQAEGKSRLGQAGRSMNKRVQSDLAQLGRDIAVLDASLTGQIRASTLNMFDIQLGKYSADAKVEAARMLRPQQLPDIPAPTMPPEPAWMEPMAVQPGYVAPPTPQSTSAPLIAGIGQAAGTLASIDWNVKGTAQEQYDPTKNLGIGASIFGNG